MPEYTWEYRVFELADDSPDGKPFWYEHGKVHRSLDDAMTDIREKKERYSKYGRKFQLMSRILTEWEPFKL